MIPLTASIDLINPWSAYKSKLEIVYEVYGKLGLSSQVLLFADQLNI